MTDDEILRMHLEFSPPDQGVQYFSGFMGCLRDARRATGRHLDHGSKLSGERHDSWLGAIGYIVLLDQIGTCFKPRGVPDFPSDAISRALKHFTTLSELEIDAIYALRNAFAHDFSIYNINTSSKRKLTHRFRIYPAMGADVVMLPLSSWDGDYTHFKPENETGIDVEALGDLVEEICRKIFSLTKSGELEVLLKGGLNELASRYGFAFSAGG